MEYTTKNWDSIFLNFINHFINLKSYIMTDKKNPKAEQKGDNILNFMKGFMIFADLGNDTLEDRVKTKERIVFATMRKLIYGWEKPKDWDSLTDEVKMERLDKLQNMDV